MFGADAQRIGIDHLNRLDVLVIRTHPGIDSRVENAVEIPLGRLGIKRRAVMKFDALHQMEHVRLALIQNVPGFCQLGHHF